ncbi:hypothetical protein I4U23_013257 [Adineta vaga]|nr:hypothetical protein I4U23_013257 [Adineta vaga]
MNFIWQILLFVLLTEADHFRGGTISWKPISNNITVGQPISIMITQTYSWTLSLVGCNNSMIAAQSPSVNTGTKVGSGISLFCNDSCSTAGGYIGNEVPITGPCIDFSSSLDLTVSQRSDIVNLTANSTFTATFSTGGGWQILALGSSAGWSISNRIDLRARSDNGLINTSPVATCISYISVPVGIPQTIQIPVLDADNDFIRCRFANGSSECVNTCPPASLPVGTTLSSSCLLTITGITAGDYYLVAIQVEDYMTNTSIIPLSSVPLQFLIRVYANQNCTLKPLLIADTNNNVCQGVQVGVSFTITWTVINRCGDGRIINDIATVSFPILLKSTLVQNITNTSLWTTKMTWTPTANQVGSQVFCAVANDNATIQSDQYCISFFVGLNSAPLCPGVTVSPTTIVTTMQTSISLAADTSQQTTQISTAVTYTSSAMTIISTSSSIRSSTVKIGEKVDWPVILGLSLLTLLLALCCLSLCCYYFL